MQITIREARPSDAQKLIAYMQELTQEPGIHLSWSPGEFNLTVDEERKFLEDHLEADNSIFLVAEASRPAPVGEAEDAFDGLTELERQIVSMRYGLGGERPMSIEEVTEGTGISRERLREIETRILRKLPGTAKPEMQIVGALNCTGGKRLAGRHAVILGISVHKHRRGQGVGKALMTRAIEWARSTGIVTRIQLEVYAHNAPAIHLYEKLGFEVEGRCRRSFRQDGEYVDTLIMGLLLDDRRQTTDDGA
jgi:ribosomal protein S18 acetylase RimI-like enzyme